MVFPWLKDNQVQNHCRYGTEFMISRRTGHTLVSGMVQAISAEVLQNLSNSHCFQVPRFSALALSPN